MNGKAPVVHRERTLVPAERIVIREEFVIRKGRQDDGHVRTLAQAVVNLGALDPVLLWSDGGELVLLDGIHRLAAYRRARWRGPVPAVVVSCDRRTALLLAAGANAKDKLSLTPQEKADLAWRLVREPGMSFSKAEIAAATGVSKATVARMRARFRALKGNPEAITGTWWKDRQDNAADTEGGGVSLDDKQRRSEIAALVGEIRDLLDRRKRPDRPILLDNGAVDEALAEALGVQRVRQLIDWCFPSTDEFEEWETMVEPTGSPDPEDEDLDF